MSIPKYKICGLRWLLFGTGILILAALTLKCDPALYDRIEALEKNATTTDSICENQESLILVTIGIVDSMRSIGLTNEREFNNVWQEIDAINEDMIDLEISVADSGYITLTPVEYDILKWKVATRDSVTYDWDSNDEPDLAGYIFYYQKDGFPIQDIGVKDTTITIEFWNGTYTVFLKAYDHSRNISAPSDTLKTIVK